VLVFTTSNEKCTNINKSSKLLIEAYDLPYTPEELAARNLSRQLTKWKECKFLPGALELLQYLDANNIPIALATSSTTIGFERKTAHLDHGFKFFGEHIVTGDDARIPNGRGKPFPDIWLTALKSLNSKLDSVDIQPHECLVFEDALPGIIAGKAAGAYVIWVPDERALKVMDGEEYEHIGDQGVILRSLEHFKPKDFGL
jgi:pseudouridine-5'-monophosphatase